MSKINRIRYFSEIVFKSIRDTDGRKKNVVWDWNGQESKTPVNESMKSESVMKMEAKLLILQN